MANTILLLVVIFGVAAWCLVLITKLQLGRVLPLELRRAVPWNGVVVIVIALTFFFLSIVSVGAAQIICANTVGEIPADRSLMTLEQLAIFLVAGSTGMILTLVIAYFVSKEYCGAKASDFGVDFSSVFRDIGIGAITFILLLPPVFGLRALLYFLIKPIAPEIAEQKHSILETLSQDPAVGYWVLLTLIVMVAAPVTEEFFFRSFLQGWFEKFFTKSFANKSLPSVVPAEDSFLSNRSDVLQEEEGFAKETVQPEMTEYNTSMATSGVANPYSSPGFQEVAAVANDFPAQHTQTLKEHPHLAKIAIICSAVFFALMHINNSLLDPLPLFVWALIVGYVYQRTHRILPCIVAHSLFNGLNILLLATGGGK